MTRTRESAGQRDLEQWKAGFLDQVMRMIEPQCQIVLAERATEMLTEESFEMAYRHVSKTCQLAPRRRMLQGLLHSADHAQKGGIRDTKPFSQRHSLRIVPFANVGL